MNYEELQIQNADLNMKEMDLSEVSGLSGLYFNGNIAIEKKLTQTQKTCVLAEELGYHGVVLEAYGCGAITNYRRNLLPAIEKMIHKGMVVAATTQSIFDGCDLSQYEVGVRALKLGVIPAGDLTTEALVVRTMIALGRWTDKKDIEAFLRGDMSPVDRSVPLTAFIE